MQSSTLSSIPAELIRVILEAYYQPSTLCETTPLPHHRVWVGAPSIAPLLACKLLREIGEPIYRQAISRLQLGTPTSRLHDSIDALQHEPRFTQKQWIFTTTKELIVTNLHVLTTTLCLPFLHLRKIVFRHQTLDIEHVYSSFKSPRDYEAAMRSGVPVFPSDDAFDTAVTSFLHRIRQRDIENLGRKYHYITKILGESIPAGMKVEIVNEQSVCIDPRARFFVFADVDQFSLLNQHRLTTTFEVYRSGTTTRVASINHNLTGARGIFEISAPPGSHVQEQLNELVQFLQHNLYIQGYLTYY